MKNYELPDGETYGQVVERIITDGMAKQQQDRVCKYWVVEMLKIRVGGCHLLNAAIAAGTDTNNGLANLQAGAEAIYRIGMKRLWRKFVVDDAWITRKGHVAFVDVGVGI
jgi:hypothetical protein